MRWDDGFVTWDHITELYNMQKTKILTETNLTEGALKLTSYSKVKNKPNKN